MGGLRPGRRDAWCEEPMTEVITPTAFALRMSGIAKAFPGVQALDDAGLEVREGEIHGLVGENGAGKSTIIKILAGVYPADAGNVEIGGEVLAALTPQAVRERGVRFIHQELSLVPHFTVAESVFMAQEIQGVTGLRTRHMRRRAEEYLAETLGVELDGRTLIRDLTVAQRKLVQIARALVDGEARLVVFDEPTAVLGAGDIEQLFSAIRGLKRQGISMVYVSHYLSEISEICDRVTVFRNGSNVGVVQLDGHTAAGDGAGQLDVVGVPPEIITLMVGRAITDMYPERTAHAGEPVLEVSDLGDGSRFRNVSFEVRAGEVVGLAGIIGSGRLELIEAIYGIRRSRSGEVRIGGEAVTLRSPAVAVAAGAVLVPRDRRNDGLVLDMSVGDNINLATLDDVSTRLGWLRRALARARADRLVDRLDVRPRRSGAITGLLSGGNQQKVVLARWLATGAKVFLLDEPTTGVDIGARSEIYKIITSLAEQQAGVLLSSNNLGELLGLCDRVLVMVRGEIIGEYPTSDLTLDALVSLATSGVAGKSAAA